MDVSSWKPFGLGGILKRKTFRTQVQRNNQPNGISYVYNHSTASHETPTKIITHKTHPPLPARPRADKLPHNPYGISSFLFMVSHGRSWLVMVSWCVGGLWLGGCWWIPEFSVVEKPWKKKRNRLKQISLGCVSFKKNAIFKKMQISLTRLQFNEQFELFFHILSSIIINTCWVTPPPTREAY